MVFIFFFDILYFPVFYVYYLHNQEKVMNNYFLVPNIYSLGLNSLLGKLLICAILPCKIFRFLLVVSDGNL